MGFRTSTLSQSYLDKLFKKYPHFDCSEMRKRMSNRDVVEWASEGIRKQTPKGERQHCYVCGGYKQITELHHLIPVEELTLIMLFYRLDHKELYTPTAWLCPNHHAIFHLIQSNLLRNGKEAIKLEHIEGMTSVELDKIVKLFCMVDKDKYKEMMQTGVPLDWMEPRKVKAGMPDQLKLSF